MFSTNFLVSLLKCTKLDGRPRLYSHWSGQYTTVYHSIPQYITVYHSIPPISQYTTVYHLYHSIPLYTTYITVYHLYHSIPQYTTVYPVYHSISQYIQYTTVYHSIPQYIRVYCSYITYHFISLSMYACMHKCTHILIHVPPPSSLSPSPPTHTVVHRY